MLSRKRSRRPRKSPARETPRKRKRQGNDRHGLLEKTALKDSAFHFLPGLLSRRVTLVLCRSHFRSNGRSGKAGCAAKAFLREVWPNLSGTELATVPPQHINFGNSHHPPRKIIPKCPFVIPRTSFMELLGCSAALYSLTGNPEISRNFPASWIPESGFRGKMKLTC